jgi:hypothetical protein
VTSALVVPYRKHFATTGDLSASRRVPVSYYSGDPNNPRQKFVQPTSTLQSPARPNFERAAFGAILLTRRGDCNFSVGIPVAQIPRRTEVKIAASVALAILIATPVVHGQAADAASELARLDRLLQQAVVDGRVELLDSHLSEDFTFTHGEDTKDNKAVWVNRAKQVPNHYLRRDVSRQTVELHGDVGLVFGRLDTRGFPPSADPKTAIPRCLAIEYVHAYARRHARWMFVSHRTTRVIEESRPCP